MLTEKLGNSLEDSESSCFLFQHCSTNRRYAEHFCKLRHSKENLSITSEKEFPAGNGSDGSIRRNVVQYQ